MKIKLVRFVSSTGTLNGEPIKNFSFGIIPQEFGLLGNEELLVENIDLEDPELKKYDFKISLEEIEKKLRGPERMISGKLRSTNNED